MLAWLALCIHWFNPLVWLAYGLSEKDMEMSCDEAVIRELGPGVKKAYTTSLLSMAAGRSRLARTPIAFGEQDTGSRIRHVLRYKKPGEVDDGSADVPLRGAGGLDAGESGQQRGRRGYGLRDDG